MIYWIFWWAFPFSHLRNLNLRPKFLYGNDRKSHADLLINGGASFRWSFGPHSAWGSIESTTILTTHPSLHKSEKNIWMSVKPCVFSGPCITSGPWIPICWPVRGALHFWVIPLLRPVHGFLYFSRSRDPYILNSPWIPIFWTVHGSLYPAKLYHITNYGLSRGTSFFRGDSDLRTVHCTNSPSVNSLKYWSAKLYLWKKILVLIRPSWEKRRWLRWRVFSD